MADENEEPTELLEIDPLASDDEDTIVIDGEDAAEAGGESTAKPRSTTVRRAPMVFGLILIGVGATAAMSAQTGLSLAQSASIWTLACATVLLVFLISSARANGIRPD